VGADGSWECCRRAAAGPQTLEAVKKEVDKESRFTEKPKVDKEAEKKKKEKEKEKEKEKKLRKERKEASKRGNVEDDGWACVGTPVKRGGVGKAKSQSGSGPNSPLPISRQGSRENLAKKPATNRGGFAALWQTQVRMMMTLMPPTKVKRAIRAEAKSLRTRRCCA